MADLPEYLGQHVLISALALAIGMALSLPLAVLGARSRMLRWPVLTVASVIQTIPSLALLALFYPVLLAVAYVTERALGLSFSALGFLPTIIALTLYSMLPILRNTVTGILNVDPAMTEAARGLGMRPRQVLFRVELPLALPVIIAGIRTATVWVVGIATLSTPVGQASLGNYIFAGLHMENWISVLFGCAVAAALAIVLDQLIGLMQSAAATRSSMRALAAAIGLVLVIGGGLSPLVARGRAGGARREVVVGAKTFAEQYVLAAVLRNRLADAGIEATTREGLGSTVVFRALAGNEIDCYVDYSGTIWVNHMGREDIADAQTVLREVTAWLKHEHGIVCLGALGFENAYALAMRRERAEALGVRTIAGLAAHTPTMQIGGSYEFFGRPEWPTIREAYGLHFAGRRQYQATFMYKAVQSGDVDVIAAFSSDGRITAYDLVVLKDPSNAIPPYDAVLLLSPKAAKMPRLAETLRPLIGAVPVDLMREANHMVSRDENKRTVDEAARWLLRQIHGTTP